ncbi:hypothetical protein ACFWAY_53485 [Rhodococcus sp. NPDC059968]|uniref:hypothetical protein n=1 Tax=Rhodococcus sp. NPDC059968 TaxID=3347017 RepID=UPI00366D8BDA
MSENSVSPVQDRLRYTDEQLKQEAHDLADRVRQSMPYCAAERDYCAFTLTSTSDLLEKLSRSMMVMLEAEAAGALPDALPFSALAHIYFNTIWELSRAITVEPFPASTPAGTGTRYPIIDSDVIEGMATLFEAFGSLLLDHGYRPTHTPDHEDPLALATKAIVRASALRSRRSICQPSIREPSPPSTCSSTPSPTRGVWPRGG